MRFLLVLVVLAFLAVVCSAVAMPRDEKKARGKLSADIRKAYNYIVVLIIEGPVDLEDLKERKFKMMEERRRRGPPEAQGVRPTPPTDEKLESFREKMRQRTEQGPAGKEGSYKQRAFDKRRAPPKAQ